MCADKEKEDLSPFQESNLFIHSAGQALDEGVYEHTNIISSDFSTSKTAGSRGAGETIC